MSKSSKWNPTLKEHQTYKGGRLGVLHCLRCGKRSTTKNGIETTLGFFCYRCVKIIHRIADQTSALRDNPKAKHEMDVEA